MKCKGTKNSVYYLKIQVLDIPAKERWTWTSFIGTPTATSSRLPRGHPQDFHGSSVRESSDRDAAAAFEEEKRKAREFASHFTPEKTSIPKGKERLIQLSIFRGELLFLGRLLNMSHLWSIQVSKYNMFNTGGWWWCIVCFSWYTWATKFGEAIEMYKALQIAKETMVVQHEETPPTTMTPATFATTFCIWTSNEFSARCLHV